MLTELRPQRLPLMMCLLLWMILPSGLWAQQPRQRLPERTPEVNRLEFTGPREGWPPKPRERANVTHVPYREIPGSLTDALEARMRRAAVSHPQVRALLGSRFAYISADEIEPDKGAPRNPSAPLAARVTFFSHANNVAVEVRMLQTQVQGARRRAGYHPPEGQDEIRLAVNLARRDSRLYARVRNLEGNAILAHPRQGQPGYGHRVLYVAFSRADEDRTLYFALVDLTAQQVLSAGSAGRR
jgi:hypothetical protein